MGIGCPANPSSFTLPDSLYLSDAPVMVAGWGRSTGELHEAAKHPPTTDSLGKARDVAEIAVVQILSLIHPF
jgi:hypothetical protein